MNGDTQDILDLSARYSRVLSTIGSIIVDYKCTELLSNYDKNQDYWSLSAVHKRSAKKFLELCLTNGGVFIKLGQHLSTLDHLLPVEYCQTFKCLQEKATETPIKEVHQVICRSLNINSVYDLFEEFDPVPIGIASLAQVHRAILKNTQETVAVKVQHPLVDRFAPLDIQAVKIFAEIIKKIFPKFTLQWLAKEMAQNLPMELDFKNEALNAMKTRELLALINEEASIIYYVSSLFRLKKPLPVYVPKPYLSFSTNKVLVMEYMDDNGVSFENTTLKDEALLAINRCFTKLIFNYGWVHCDPHPGNFKIVPFKNEGYKLVILDHGLYRELSPHIRRAYANLWLSLIEGNETSLVDSLRELCSDNLSSSSTTYNLQSITSDGPKAHRLLSSVLSRRSWKSLELGINIATGSREPVQKHPITLTPERIGFITYIFERIHPELILVLKTNDLLVSLNFLLSNRVDPLLGYFSFVGLACASELHPHCHNLRWFNPGSWIICYYSYLFHYYRLSKYFIFNLIFS